MSDADLMLLPEVAEKCRLAEATMRWMRYSGTGPRSFKLGRRVVYRRSDVDAWIAEQYDKADREPA